jgi:hypothetical protein
MTPRHRDLGDLPRSDSRAIRGRRLRRHSAGRLLACVLTSPAQVGEIAPLQGVVRVGRCRVGSDRVLRVNDAEAVALRVREDHVVGIERSPVPVHLGGPQRQKPPHLAGLVVRVQVEMQARRQNPAGVVEVEGKVGTDPVPGAQEQEVVATLGVRNVVEAAIQNSACRPRSSTRRTMEPMNSMGATLPPRLDVARGRG